MGTKVLEYELKVWIKVMSKGCTNKSFTQSTKKKGCLDVIMT